MNREPLLTTASITGLVAAGVALIVAFGPELSKEQTAAIMGAAAVLAPLIVGLVSRGQVTPTSAVVAQTDASGQAVAGPASHLEDGTAVAVELTPANLD